MDSSGVLYLDEQEISPLLQAAADGETVVYSALGAAVRTAQATEKAIQVLEFPSLELLWNVIMVKEDEELQRFLQFEGVIESDGELCNSR